MHLGMSMEPRMGLEMQPEARQELQENERDKMANRVADWNERMREDGPLNKRAMYDDAVEKLTVVMRARKPRDADTMRGVLLREEVREASLEDPGALAIPTVPDASPIVIRYLHARQMERGGYVLQGKDPVTDALKTTQYLLTQAFLDPAKLREDVEHQQRTARMMQSISEGGLQDIQEKLAALEIIPELKPKIDTMSRVLCVGCSIEDDKKNRVFGSVFSDLVKLREMSIIAADAALRQFASRFSQINAGDTEEALRMAALNSITRAIMPALGVIETQIFKMFSNSVEPEVVMRARLRLGERGLHPLLDKKKLRKESGLFWIQRRIDHTLPTKAEAVCQDMIYGFVRDDGQALLNTLDFKELFRRVKEISRDEEGALSENAEKREGARMEIRQLFLAHMLDLPFQEHLAALVKQWQPILEQRLAEVQP